jgi:hypothetical protein
VSEPYYTVQPFGERWIVTHRLPGMTWLDCIDVDCATQAAAEKEAARMNQARDCVLARGWPWPDCGDGARA